jgi:hypothetical protein
MVRGIRNLSDPTCKASADMSSWLTRQQLTRLRFCYRHPEQLSRKLFLRDHSNGSYQCAIMFFLRAIFDITNSFRI